MRKLILPLALSAVVAAGVWACKKKTPSEPSDQTPSTPSFSSTPAVNGQASDLDLAKLAARFGTIGAAALQQTLSGSSSTTNLAIAGARVSDAGLSALAAPTTSSAVNSLFLCCSDAASTNLQVAGTVGAGTGGTIPVSLNYTTSGPLTWTGVNTGVTWELTFQTSTLTMSGTLTTAAGSVASNQQVTLVGSLQYSVPGAASKLSLPVSLTFTYPDLSVPATSDASGASVPLSTSGSIGSLQLTSSVVPSVTMTSRCSAPKEGCGPLANGNCPCTKWPPCPAYGLSCPGTFR